MGPTNRHALVQAFLPCVHNMVRVEAGEDSSSRGPGKCWESTGGCRTLAGLQAGMLSASTFSYTPQEHQQPTTGRHAQAGTGACAPHQKYSCHLVTNKTGAGDFHASHNILHKNISSP
eukprot:536258-Pelagomonas_calceolata.AAC.2